MLMPMEQGKPTTAATRRPIPASRATLAPSFRAMPAAMEGTRLVDMAMAREVGTLIIVMTMPL